MTRLRDVMQLRNIQIAEIKTDEVPLNLTLKESLFEIDQKDPIKVRKYENGIFKYEIVDGRRRLKALAESGQTQVLALVVNEMDDTELSIQALVANSGQPNPMDEARHMAKLREQGYDGKQIAKTSGYSQGRVSQTLKLVDCLIPELQELVSLGEMKISAAYETAKLPKDRQNDILNDIKNGQKPTFRFVFEKVRDWQAQELDMFDVEEDELEPGLFLSSEQLHELIDGKILNLTWNGRDLAIREV